MNNEIRYGRKASGIRRELQEKLKEWVATIDDPDVKALVAKHTIVTGGSIASMLLGERVNDYDVYFRNKATTLAVAKYYVSKFNATKTINVAKRVKPCVPEVREETIENIKGFTEDRVVVYIKSAGVAGENMSEYDYFESRSADAVEDFAETLDQSEEGELYRPVFMSQNAITLSNKMQIVIRFYGEPTEIHNNYDFVHAMNYYDFGDDKLVLHPEALEALLSRELKYKGSLYPIASIFRTKKFIERGWRITAGQMLKIMWQISEIDLRKRDVLREQLTGVDQAYMSQLIGALQDVDEEKINSTYVGAIIDRIFQ